ncbi:hypothetical protein [Terricaulis silvestris]|uniref:Uncharacterized protein n=1 Tax=Terricaulis silvestris TaxID=2686094 RepID=A0A6I6MMM6_9CAUL|nr:hypothetical protein [Terricaulis silvestris]QGZ94598.1 hypothetical protein DSM104635_01418 [Terricaulis silvestris]
MISKLPILAGSAAVIILMVSVAAALGFRPKALLDDATLARLAANEGASIEASVIAPDAKSALARLSGGKIMVARAMGGDVSARIAPASAVHARINGEKLSVRFADVGYPPLHMRVQTPPAWLADLVSGEGR